MFGALSLVHVVDFGQQHLGELLVGELGPFGRLFSRLQSRQNVGLGRLSQDAIEIGELGSRVQHANHLPDLLYVAIEFLLHEEPGLVSTSKVDLVQFVRPGRRHGRHKRNHIVCLQYTEGYGHNGVGARQDLSIGRRDLDVLGVRRINCFDGRVQSKLLFGDLGKDILFEVGEPGGRRELVFDIDLVHVLHPISLVVFPLRIKAVGLGHIGKGLDVKVLFVLEEQILQDAGRRKMDPFGTLVERQVDEIRILRQASSNGTGGFHDFVVLKAEALQGIGGVQSGRPRPDNDDFFGFLVVSLSAVCVGLFFFPVLEDALPLGGFKGGDGRCSFRHGG